MKRETGIWLGRAEGDLTMAELGLGRGLFDQCIFHCQQALEKLLKAILIERSPTSRARRSHDLVLLAEAVELTLSREQFQFLRRLGELYVPSRYGDEDVDFDYAASETWLLQTKELFAWLRQLLS